MTKKLQSTATALRRISSGELEFTFLATGAVHVMRAGNTVLNQLVGNEIDGAVGNIYLRFLNGTAVRYYPLIAGNFAIGDSQAAWSGEIKSVKYELRLKLAENSWFWEVDLEGEAKCLDLVFAQDMGLADAGMLRSNEAYTGQYIDHSFIDEVICSRQAQPQSTGFPTLESGSLDKITGFLTDGFQFFGLDYKFIRRPEALQKLEFDNKVYQYEMAMAVLKTQTFELAGKHQTVFYQIYSGNQETAFTKSTAKSEVRTIFDGLSNEKLTPVKLAQPLLKFDGILNGRELTDRELVKLYPNSKFLENYQGKLISGFTPDNSHWVSQAKERVAERETGEIFLSRNSSSVNNRGLSTTNFIYGLFNSQVVIGNTTMNKWLSNQRNHLNVFDVAGQRLFVKSDSGYKMLAMPSTFEMGYNWARWRYELLNDTLIVTNFVANKEAALQLEVESLSGKSYDFLLMNQVLMDEIEYKSDFEIDSKDAQTYEFTAGSASASKMGNPDLRYQIKFDQSVDQFDSRALFDGETFLDSSLVFFELKDNFKCKIIGALDGEVVSGDWLDFQTESERFKDYVEKDLLAGLHLQSDAPEAEKLNTILPWYAHDMSIHYLSPRGLEQYGGAAWGTRDVSQGPFEFFLATQKQDIARELILRIFDHQLVEKGDWPQGFMFDEYWSMYSDDCHGDVVVWPLLVLAEYLERTGDLSVLNGQVHYLTQPPHRQVEQTESVYQHVLKEISYISSNFLPGTHLSIYGNGDWDDTLQPANQTLKQEMTSSWTVALTYQAFRKFAAVLVEFDSEESERLSNLAEQIRQEFEHYLIVDGVIPGFALRHDDGSFEAMIHPRDEKTGIHYRLLPMDRSIIAEIVDGKQAVQNLALIKEHLTFADGIRLMDASPAYHGGVSTNFKRAEQASNFGREIGLLYVHAQIRYIETMAKLGKPQEAWLALEQTLPLGLADIVSNALPRQANTYFSSSDGDFATRYEAQDSFDKLRAGTVGVKGGWRIYSSGPGILTHQVISQLLGIRQKVDGLELDPILPDSLSDLTIDFSLEGKPVKIHYVKSDEPSVEIDGHRLLTRRLANSYRTGGQLISKADLQKFVQNGSVLTVKI